MHTPLPLTPLTAVTPLDGRYGGKTRPLAEIFSEYGLIRRRVAVETAWFLALSRETEIPEVPPLSPAAVADLQAIADDFSLEDGERVKAIEATTNHDVKAVEYFIKERFISNEELNRVSEFVHFACHQLPMTSRIGRVLRRHHAIHHHRDETVNFGVTSPLWDHVFGTLWRPQRARADRSAERPRARGPR